MNKLIPTKVHGALDYGTAGLLLALPKLLKTDAPVSKLFTNAAIATVAYSIVTRYEWGLFRVLPMRAHLAMDCSSACVFCLSPWLLKREPNGIRALLGCIGLFELTVTLLSQTNTSGEI